MTTKPKPRVLAQTRVLVSALLTGLCPVLASGNEESRQTCRTLAAAEVEPWLATKNRLVFFASWCGSCLTHLHEARSQPKTGLVLVFDEAPRGNQVLTSLGLSNDCVVSPDLVRRYGVSALPKAVVLQDSRASG